MTVQYILQIRKPFTEFLGVSGGYILEYTVSTGWN